MNENGFTKIIEECAELITIAAKYKAFPDGSYPDGSDLKLKLMDEMADTLAAIKFNVEKMDLDVHYIDDRMWAKIRQFRIWDMNANE